MPKTPAELFTFLDELGVETTTVSHPPLFTVADAQALRGQIAGAHTKNLFLKDKRDNFFLITAEEEAVVNLKTVHALLGASGKVSFGSPAALMEHLGVIAGAVSPFGLVNDLSGRVRFFLDETLAGAQTINCHPLTNEATTSISRDDLLRFAEATGHPATILKLEA